MTEPLFRFLVLRPPIAQDAANPSIILAQESDFQKSLATAAASTDPRSEMVSTSKAFIASDKFVGSTSATAFQKQVNVLSAMFNKLEEAGILDLQAVLGAVKQVFAKDAADVVKSAEFVALVEGLKDSITAIKYVQEEHSRPIAALTDQLRDLDLVQKAVKRASPPSSSVVSEPAKSAKQTGTVEPKTEATWKTDQNYKVGDRVRHKGIIYACLQAHKSQSDWPPALTPALWKPVDVTPPDPPEINAPMYRKRSLLLPVEADLQSILAASVKERKKAEDDRKKALEDAELEAAALLKKYKDVKVAVADLVKLSPDHLEVKAQTQKDPVDVDDKFGRSQFVKDQLDYRRSLRDIALGRANPALAGTQGVPETAAADPPADPKPPVQAEPVGAFDLAKDLLSTAGLLTPKGVWNPVLPEDRTPRLKSSAFTALNPTTKTVLSDRGIDIQKESINFIIKRLRRELETLLDDLKSLAPYGDNVSYTRLGAAFISTRSPIVSRTTSLLYGHRVPKSTPALPALPLDGRIPHTKGKVSPAGVADLLVVKQTLRGYQAADIAHVENVLKGESKQRTHTKTTRTETTIVAESETTNDEEHELASTTRFEMAKETSNTLKEDQSLKADLKVSAKYGPAVSVDASVEGSVSRSKEEVTKAATKYSQDVTERTVKKITERVLKKQSTTTINEIVEVNQHGINNASGTGHISGVYQWLNKQYEAQVFNYGLRMMFEFMIPEPAAFLTYALSSTANSAEAGLILEKPGAFDKTPSEITEESIGALVAKYQATDVLPPPDDYVTVSDQAKVGGGDHNTNYDHGAILTIPSGYQAVYATVSAVKNIWVKDGVCIDVMVGGETTRFGSAGSDTWGTSILNHVGSEAVGTGGNIAWAFNTFSIPDCVVSVEVLCRVTERRKQQWQAETHAKLLTAYKARLAEYEEKLARLKLDTGIAIQGTNPTANLIAIKSELKKNCISVLTAQHYDLFNSIARNPRYGYPEIDLYQAEAEGRYVRFFEQAFEWDQIMYITYPYFWGGQNNWVKKLTINDPDPVFDEFLKAGFARVVVPARPGFEGAIDHFMQLGETWDGGPLPSITSEMYVPIADEVAERSGKPQGEIPQGEPWEVTLPTTLVKLRADDKLPTWPDK